MNKTEMLHHTHQKHTRDGHDHHNMMIQEYKTRFIVSLILTIPILILSPFFQNIFKYSLDAEWVNRVLLGLSSVLYVYGGLPFLKGFYQDLKNKKPGMMTLVSVAISSAFFYSSAVLIGLQGSTFFWELATLIDVMLLGHLLEMKSILGASKAMTALAELMPSTAHKVDADGVVDINTSELKNDDLVLVKPGEKLPADGIVEEGEGEVNESMLTGESAPVKKCVDDFVIGGSVNGNGRLILRTTGLGSDSYLSKVIKLVKDAQLQKSRSQRLADVAARWLTLVALLVGFGSLFIWLVLGADVSFALERMVTVMLISCPHALGLAVPLVASISTAVSAKNGLLIRNRTAFENARKVTTIVFDKTGTLTEGSHEVVQIKSTSGKYSDEMLLTLATAVEGPSEHHISKGLRTKAEEMFLDIPRVRNFTYSSGIGVSGDVKNLHVQVGGFLLLKKFGIAPPDEFKNRIETVVFVLVNNNLEGYITFVDAIRKTSFHAINALKEHGIKCILLTGDNKEVAKYVASELGLNEFQYEVLPDQKQSVIVDMQMKGEFVAMTGDGVNDAPALAQADVGIAIGSGTDVAAETADIILVNSNPNDIVDLLRFGNLTYMKMMQNLVWATGYNIIAIPLATGVISGLVISPAIGAALMAISTIVCAVNAQLLKSKMTNISSKAIEQ